jgi:hypothetical protein
LKRQKKLAEQGYKWSGHTHTGVEAFARTPSDGDYKVLAMFPQKQSAIYDMTGNFDKFDNLLRKEQNYV